MRQAILTALLVFGALGCMGFYTFPGCPLGDLDAHDFHDMCGVDGIEYALNRETMEAVVTNESVFYDMEVPDTYSGIVDIPETFEFEGRTYTVIGIYVTLWNEWAPAEEWVTEVIVPATVKYAYIEDVWNKTIVLHEGIEWLAGFYAYDKTSMEIPSTVKEFQYGFLNRSSHLERLFLPPHPVKLGADLCGLTSLERIILPCPVPYEIPEEAFEGVNLQRCVLEVPRGCAQAYSDCAGWSRFKIVEEGDAGAGMTAGEDKDAIYYDLTGRRIANPEPGRAVIRLAEGKAEKIMMQDFRQ